MTTVRFVIVCEDERRRGKGIANFTFRGDDLEFTHGEVYSLWPDLITFIEAQALHWSNDISEMCWEQRYYFVPEHDFCLPPCFRKHECPVYWKHKKTGHIVQDGDLVPMFEVEQYEKVK